MGDLVLLEDLIAEGDEILGSSVTKTSGGVRSVGWITREPTVSGQRTYKQIDSVRTKSWAINCLNLIEKLCGRESNEYLEFKKDSNRMSFDGVRLSIAVLSAIKRDYAYGRLKTQLPAVENHDLQALIDGGCELEATRNTRRTMLEILILLVLISGSVFYFLGIAYAFAVTLGTAAVGYFLSALYLQDWGLTKVPERLYEKELDRLRERFHVQSE